MTQRDAGVSHAVPAMTLSCPRADRERLVGTNGEDGAHRRAHVHEDHEHGHGDHAAEFRDRFWLSLVLSLPVVVYSTMVQHWFGYSAPSFPGDGLIAPALGTVVYVYGGRPFLTGAVDEVRRHRPGMMLLIAMAITVAFAASWATSLDFFDLDFWWELAALVVIMLLGHWMEMRALGQARGALSALAELLPDEAERLRGEDVETVPVSALAEGDVVLVRPGGRVPADGALVSRAADLDESMITGESRPVGRIAGETVVAGSVVAGSSARVRVSAVGDATRLAGIQRLVAEAETSRSGAQALADRAAGLLFYVAAGAAVLTLLIWLLFVRDADAAVTRTVTVLVISCPHALGLAIPLVIALATSLSARQGILVRERLSLERMRNVDTVLFDKTGTLTHGDHTVTGVVALDGDEDRLLLLAAAVERESEHPVARAITAAGRRRGELPAASGFRSLPGRGVEAVVGGVGVAVGGPGLLRERGFEPSPELVERTVRFCDRGASVLHVVRGGDVLGAVALEDRPREVSRQAVSHLRARGLRVAMITGDAGQVAGAVARDLGIDEVFAEVLPEDKDTKVRELQAAGRRVAMVGDGVNDAPALARADVGIAIGAGTDVAIDAAGIVLASDDPRGVLSVLRLSRAGYRKMVQNLGWALGYNAVALPIAAGVAAPIGLTVPPGLAAILMSVSTVVVVLNAQLLAPPGPASVRGTGLSTGRRRLPSSSPAGKIARMGSAPRTVRMPRGRVRDANNAVVTWVDEPARPRDGPLAGRTLLVKDVIDTAGIRTTYGSQIYADHVPATSAPVVERLVAAGAVVVGKGNLDEFAWGVMGQNPWYGTVRNPARLGRTAGGSSAGNAAALAAGLVELGLGTDTGCSIRLPSACCGTVGLKPSWGRIPTGGVHPLVPSLDTVGPMARSVADVALMWSVLTGEPVPQPQLSGLTVGLVRAAPVVGDGPTVPDSAAAEAYAADLQRLGVRIVETRIPNPRANLWPIFYAEARAAHLATFPSRAGEYGENCRVKLEAAQHVDAGALETAYRALREWRRYEPEVDLYVTPAFGVAVPPEDGDELSLRATLPAFLRPVNFLGWAGLAIGDLQLTAPADETVLAAGLAWERDRPPREERM